MRSAALSINSSSAAGRIRQGGYIGDRCRLDEASTVRPCRGKERRCNVAWIETIREDEWSGDLAEMRRRVEDPEARRVDNIMQIHSLNPAAMAAHDALYRSAMAGTKTLRKVERELIALVVSSVNDCHY